MNGSRFSKLGFALLRFVVYFVLIAFVVTCSFLIFLNAMDIEQAALEKNAKRTFLNIIFLTFIFWLFDMIRRELTVERPVRRIIRSLDRIMEGDFSVQIANIREATDSNKFNIIIDRINKMTAELSGVETLRTDFTANVSHELKTPLSAISNYGALLQSPGLSEAERIEYAKAVTDASRRLSGLITNILKLSKLENQQIYPVRKPYDLGEQLCECLLGFEEDWERKKLKIDTDIDENVIISADSELLSLVWNNLFSNAVKFTDENGSIFVSLKKDNGYAVVSVTDTGCGMSAETGKHIFEKFYQGDTSHSSKGNGLGLALVKRAADITGGEISVQSELGKGSVFTVKLRCGESEKA
ncbi:HAMP domain-containing sensor histidine kinase [Ruminococcus sp. Marseille-P6503]|uniref:sensor histidine kinase n=1 Tax=Ruminococcus sp. Marseille-P6503 TaxID=2364796 RepID=UPI000F53BCB5|nr:HAMP domain-containing sensor histidine kinase [Ruminococcus sp. Marseille-P6503]